MKQSESLEELAKALVAAQGEFVAIPKTANNPFFKSAYADLPTAVEAASPILKQHGLSVSQLIDYDGQSDLLTTMLLHESGQFLSSTMRLHLNKMDAQSQGSATTYARRYSYMAILGLVADIDDDGNATRQQPQSNSQSKPAAKKAAPQQPVIDLTARIKALPTEDADVINKRIADNNFPSPLPAGAVRTVTKWIEEAELKAPF